MSLGDDKPYQTPYPIMQEGEKIESIYQRFDKLLSTLGRIEDLLYDIKYGLKNGIWTDD